MSRLLIPLVRLERTRRPKPEDVLTPWCKLVGGLARAVPRARPGRRRGRSVAAAAELLGEYGPDQVVGHPLLDVVDLVDFHGGTAGAVYADRIAPLLALGRQHLVPRAAAGPARRRRHPYPRRRRSARCTTRTGQVAGVVAFLASIWT